MPHPLLGTHAMCTTYAEATGPEGTVIAWPCGRCISLTGPAVPDPLTPGIAQMLHDQPETDAPLCTPTSPCPALNRHHVAVQGECWWTPGPTDGICHSTGG